MAMIALSGFVVEADYALAPDHERQPVLEGVPAPSDRWIGHAPDDQLDERIRSDNMSFVEEKDRLHVGHFANTREGMSMVSVGYRYNTCEISFTDQLRGFDIARIGGRHQT